MKLSYIAIYIASINFDSNEITLLISNKTKFLSRYLYSKCLIYSASNFRNSAIIQPIIIRLDYTPGNLPIQNRFDAPCLCFTKICENIGRQTPAVRFFSSLVSHARNSGKFRQVNDYGGKSSVHD